MKYGVFLPNGSNGYIPSAGSPVYLPTFEHNKAISVEAEKQGLDFVLSMMKFRGFGGDTGYWDACLESFTLMAAIAAATDKIELFPSISLLSQHPAYVARMVATIDDISGGRCGLNIVTGWNKPEYEQMGLWPGDEYYEQRYEYAADYLAILRQLWRDGTATHESEHFQLDDCRCLPTPQVEIPIVCAGNSPLGKQFVADMADQQFVMSDAKKLKASVLDINERAAKAGRQVGIYALFHIITSETDKQAARIGQEIIDQADNGALRNMLASADLDTNTGGTSDQLKAGLNQTIDDGNLAFMGIPVIHGSFETVARKIDRIGRDTGIDGMLFSWPDFVSGVRDFGERVKPLLS
jgi:pyrimidine oxygenase